MTTNYQQEKLAAPPTIRIPNIWVSSDPHASHHNIVHKFEPPRPFESVEHMNETMIERHNARVKPEDKYYCLGDIAFNAKAFHAYMSRLNGKKRLILGNHDNLRMDEYYKYFEKIMIWRTFGEFKSIGAPLTLTHVPIALECFRPVDGFNVHGHIHFRKMENPRYINVCMEHTDYSPVHIEDIIARVKKL